MVMDIASYVARIFCSGLIALAATNVWSAAAQVIVIFAGLILS
jgi:hypothetical protein